MNPLSFDSYNCLKDCEVKDKDCVHCEKIWDAAVNETKRQLLIYIEFLTKYDTRLGSDEIEECHDGRFVSLDDVKNMIESL